MVCCVREEPSLTSTSAEVLSEAGGGPVWGLERQLLGLYFPPCLLGHSGESESLGTATISASIFPVHTAPIANTSLCTPRRFARSKVRRPSKPFRRMPVGGAHNAPYVCVGLMRGGAGFRFRGVRARTLDHSFTRHVYRRVLEYASVGGMEGTRVQWRFGNLGSLFVCTVCICLPVYFRSASSLRTAPSLIGRNDGLILPLPHSAVGSHSLAKRKIDTFGYCSCWLASLCSSRSSNAPEYTAAVWC